MPHPEDLDTNLWKKYVHEEKTANIAHHGHTGEQDASRDSSKEDRRASTTSNETSQTRFDEEHPTNDIGMRVDPEKGKDLNVIHFEDNDPENPMVGILEGRSGLSL